LIKRIVFILFWAFIGCHQSRQIYKDVKPAQNYFEYARHIDLQDFGNFKLLTVHQAFPGAPDFTYLIQNKNATIPDSLSGLPKIKIPLENVVVTSTTHLPALEMLGITDKLIGFPHTEYISNSLFRKRISTGKIVDVGNGRQLNTEKILALHPGAIIKFSSGTETNDDRFFMQNGIPVIYNADWMEQNPLGRAEWIKFFGILFDKEKEAGQVFKQIAQKYLSIKKQIDTTRVRPVVFQGGLFGDKWFVPGGKSYAAQLIKDAGGQYLWQSDTHNGSITVNFENVLLQLPKANIWLNPGMVNSREKLVAQLPQIKDLSFFKNGKIYTYNLVKGQGGGVLYFEESNAHPERVLNDLYRIFHQRPVNESKLYYYRALP